MANIDALAALLEMLPQEQLEEAIGKLNVSAAVVRHVLPTKDEGETDATAAELVTAARLLFVNGREAKDTRQGRKVRILGDADALAPFRVSVSWKA